MSVAPVLSLRQVWFSYPDSKQPVLEDISFDILPGTINAILGANGAGKSTLLHLILGMYTTRQGEILLSGRLLREYTRQVLSQQISLVLQREHVPFDYSVLEYVLLGRTPHLGYLHMPQPGDVDIAQATLERLGIAELADRRVNSLSGGEHQLTLIARAIVQDTPVLLLDEPTSHLDLGNKKRILALLSDLAAQGITILITTHDPETALLIADHIIMIRSGRLLRQGTPEETFTAEVLSQIYETTVRVLTVDSQKVILLDMPKK